MGIMYYLNLEFHRVFRNIQLFFKMFKFKQILIALYTLYVTNRYVKTKCMVALNNYKY